MTSIGSNAFSYCSSLESVTISNNISSINDFVFSGCTSITSINIPNSVTSIGVSAFGDCTSLAFIVVPISLTSIGSGAFLKCSNISSIVVDHNNPKYDSRNDCNAIIETETNTLILGCKNTVIPNSVTSLSDLAFSYCTGLTSISIPNGVKTIGYGSFSYCTSLTSVTIPDGVKSIGDFAFGACEKLTDVYCYAENVPKIYKGTFNYNYYEPKDYMTYYANMSMKTLHVPTSSIQLYKDTRYWREFGNIVTLTDSDPKPTDIKTYANDNCINEIYTIDGKKINQPHKSINIFRTKDGKTMKVINR